MSEKAPFVLRPRNPDVLSCIANLSNDEVFTPPEFAKRMLDTLAAAWAAGHGGADLFSNPDVRFLDPCTKSGVFLREITTRLVRGLEQRIPYLQARVDHVLTRQVFGIATTHLTSLLSRRSLYCSKHATGKHSIATGFTDDTGHIWFERIEHQWRDGRCHFCGAGRGTLDRGESHETHAYTFIHTDNIKARIEEIFGAPMQFDVIIGNPPYQLGSNGGTRDMPIYQKFVEQAKQLQPRFLSMVIPARWMASGLGLTEFRQDMLSDRRIRELHDFPGDKEVFPNNEVKAGVCYFLWDATYQGDCTVTTTRGGEVVGPIMRDLRAHDVFVRDSRAIAILEKVRGFNEPSINGILARDKEFGWTSNFDGFHAHARRGDVPLHYIRLMKRAVGYISRQEVVKSAHLIDTWKVLVPQAFNGGDSLPHQILGRPLIAGSPSVCTQSFLFFYVESETAAKSVQSYYLTRFFRFLVSLRKITQHATHSTYAWVPMQTWDRDWTDDALYEKYGITSEEQAYIATQVKPLVLNDAADE